MRTQSIRPRRVHAFVSSIFDHDLHEKRVASLADATVGALQGAQLAVGALGRALAIAKDLDAKHAIQQVDRLFSNTGVDVWGLFANWVPFVLGARPEIVVALDWTDFDQDNQSTIALYLVTKHGRATPLMWKSVMKSELKDWRNEHEDALLERFREVVPTTTRVTLLADRGFGWVPDTGRPKTIRNARVTQIQRTVAAVVCVHAKGMAEPWHLATSRGDKSGADIVKGYGRRFSIEETFRDLKNLRFGMGLTDTRISSPERRDRILLVGAIAASLLTLLGAAGEALGFDRKMKANTVKTRTHSLLDQGLFYFDCLLNMRDERARPLMQRFDELLRQHAATREIFGLI